MVFFTCSGIVSLIDSGVAAGSWVDVSTEADVLGIGSCGLLRLGMGASCQRQSKDQCKGIYERRFHCVFLLAMYLSGLNGPALGVIPASPLGFARGRRDNKSGAGFAIYPYTAES